MKKLTDDQRAEILEAGIDAFAQRGFHGASMQEIARAAGISVGVLYKYYADKEDFFNACLGHSLQSLEELLQTVTAREDKLLQYAAGIIRGLQAFSRAHPNHIRLYHQLTASSGPAARRLAEEVEGLTARLYTAYIARAQAAGDLRRDMDPRFFAFFFDNLLMMLQFSHCCDYYRARFALYCGADAGDDALVETELLKFLESAFTLERAAISHREEGEKPHDVCDCL